MNHLNLFQVHSLTESLSESRSESLTDSLTPNRIRYYFPQRPLGVEKRNKDLLKCAIARENALLQLKPLKIVGECREFE